MDVYGKWFSELGIIVEFEKDSLLTSGKFTVNTITRSFRFRGICMECPDKYKLSFIITWENNTKTLTVFTGKLLEETLLSLDWLLFVENEATSEISTLQGNMLLNRSPTGPTLLASTQDKLPYPEILYNESLI